MPKDFKLIVLDCETVDSTYNSLAKVFGVDRAQIEAVFVDLDLEHFYAENPYHPKAPEDIILARLQEISPNVNPVDHVCWFHLTRTLPSNNFNEGILPLGSNIDAIWDILFSLTEGRVSFDEWKQFRKLKATSGNERAIHHAYLYNLKLSNRLHWGPFGMLVRDIAFQPAEAFNHDYLEIPEIVEDICICFSASHNFDLRSGFIRNTRPCIVKFYDDTVREDLVKIGLYYLFTTFHSKVLSFGTNTCFDSHGSAIPSERILSVQFL